MQVISFDDLPVDVVARDFIGRDHGGIPFTFLIVEAAPGDGPKLHRHAYPEVFIILEGEMTATIGDETGQVDAGNVVIVPAHTAHKFINSGSGPLRSVDIHASDHFITEWLE